MGEHFSIVTPLPEYQHRLTRYDGFLGHRNQVNVGEGVISALFPGGVVPLRAAALQQRAETGATERHFPVDHESALVGSDSNRRAMALGGQPGTSRL